ncbi:hypothetical protein [Streptomyces sp. NPDC102437]|uniref:hypothetical protein n=1 Tax=Streptomyces sp. NPDC102437 TaxID=3366175 RepID=UPI003817F8EF
MVLGSGARLFPEVGQRSAFERTEARETPSGISIHTHRPTGRARFGTFPLDD